jgi:hypothetical protein
MMTFLMSMMTLLIVVNDKNDTNGTDYDNDWVYDNNNDRISAKSRIYNEEDEDVCYNVIYNGNDLYIDVGPVVGWEQEQQRGRGEDQQQDGAAGEGDLRPQAQGGGVLHRHRGVRRQTKWNWSVLLFLYFSSTVVVENVNESSR